MPPDLRVARRLQRLARARRRDRLEQDRPDGCAVRQTGTVVLARDDRPDAVRAVVDLGPRGDARERLVPVLQDARRRPDVPHHVPAGVDVEDGVGVVGLPEAEGQSGRRQRLHRPRLRAGAGPGRGRQTILGKVRRKPTPTTSTTHASPTIAHEARSERNRPANAPKNSTSAKSTVVRV
ncbi:Uncharacterised protein [Mycobacteroides abscessus]|nr:Uncharacterised protein [Mycobacteroides abscessus]